MSSKQPAQGTFEQKKIRWGGSHARPDLPYAVL